MNSELHIITPEYPPQIGGVSDYTRQLARSLAEDGGEVQVWCPAGEPVSDRGVQVRCDLGHMRPADLRRMGRALNQSPEPRRLLVQWVPHGYGYKSMNLGFCAWLWARSVLRRDHVELMVHEPFFSFGEGAWRQNLVALVHRLMTVIVLAAARRVWVSIPAWESMLKPWAWIGRADFGWLPVPSNVPVDYKQAETRSIRRAYLGGEQRLLIGHFGTHGTPFLEEVVESLLRNHPDAALLFMGRASQEFRDGLEHKFPEFAGRLHASGVLSPVALSHHFSACDLMLQPYIDGISSRRTSAMSALAHGLPVVTTIGRLTETLWRDGEAVALAPVGDAAAFIAEAHALLSDSEKRRGLGERARALYQDRFDICHVVAALRNSPQALSQCVS